MMQEADCELKWSGTLFAFHPASPGAEKCERHRVRKASVELRRFFAHGESTGEDRFTGAEENVLEHYESFLLRLGGKERSFCCSHQVPRSTSCSCS